MKKPTFSKFILVAIVLLLTANAFSQVLQPFGKEYDASLKGDILVIGNNVLNRDFGTTGNRANDPYNAIGSSSVYNESINMKWINIDPDGGNNFNSSRAKLTIPAASQSCYKIAYAALYWSGTYSISATNGSASGADRSIINKVRFKAGTNPYVNLTGKVIYDYVGSGSPAIPQNVPATAQGARNPYACMIDVTTYVRAGGEVNYTVANIASSEGGSGTSAGHSAGWSLFVVYEDPKLPGKYITSYNGFTRIRGGDPAFSFPIDGFRTIPAGPVKAKLAFATLEGDNKDSEDYMEIRGASIAGSITERLSTPTIRPIVSGGSNFFNSSINNEDSYFTDRVPNSINTMGYDTGVLTLSNPSNNTIKNSETKANITLGTGSDWYYLFFTALSIEIIEPEIILTKRVLDDKDNDIGGQNVTFDKVLNYVIRFQNVGNDNAQNFTIEDTLPINVVFNYPADIINLPVGITVRSYNAATRKLIFDIDKNLVEKNDPYKEFRIRVQVVSGCNALDDACSNIIDNSAIANYTGTIDPDSGTVISINSNNQCLAEPKATNFLVGIDGCIYATDVTLCGNSLVLTAGNGYDKYAWSKFPFDSAGNATGPILGTGQSYTINDIGTYYVRDTAIAPCRSITQQFNVTRFGGIVSNPIIPFADQVVTCPDNGKKLPNIYLCGGNDSRIIRTGISGVDSIVWQRLTGGCATTTNPTCASEGSSCTWATVGNGPDFTVATAGEYRLVINYAGGCFNLFYFNVYKNNFTPTATVTDIYCNTPGRIVVTNPAQGTGYEYSLSSTGPFVSTNTFSIITAGTYTAYVRQVGVPTNPCIFDVKNLQVLNRAISVQEIVQQPLCKGDKATVTLNVNDVRGQYYLSFSKGASTIVNPIPQASNQFVIQNLDVGTYNYTVTTDDGCIQNGSILITEPSLLTANVILTKPLTCTNGEFVVTPVGGTAPYVYYVNGSATFQSTTSPFVISSPLPAAGVYSIKVVDANNCEATTSLLVTDNPKPVYNLSSTAVLCLGSNTGEIKFNVINANGYSLAYSIDNGVNYFSNGTFSNIAAGTYTPVLRYTLNGENCFDTQANIIISQPAASLSASITNTNLSCSSSGTVPAVVTVTASGGTGPWQYSFNGNINFSSTNTFSTATVGIVNVYVKDANNCQIGPLSVSITTPEQFSAITITDSGWDCSTTPPGGHVNIAGIGVSAPKRYSIISGPAGFDPTENSDGEFKGLIPGAYVFQARDTKSNCTLTRPYTISGVPDIVAGGSISTPIKCFGDRGAIQFTVSGLNSHRYDYVITNSMGAAIDNKNNQSVPTISLSNLPASTYTIVVTDRTTKCTAAYSLNLNQPTALVSVLATATNINCINDNSQITVIATGGTTNYSYAYAKSPSAVPTSVFGSSNVLTIDTNSGADLSWDVYVQDTNGCTAKSTVNVIRDIFPTVTAVVDNQCTVTGSNFTIRATGTGGVAPLTYGIGGPTGTFQSTQNFTVAPGTYTVWVKDANGCTASTSAPITVYSQLTANAVVTKTLDCSTSPDAVITTAITGGKAPFTYTIQKGSGTPSTPASSATSTFTMSVINANADTYTFVITDANGCSTTTTTSINPISSPTVTATPTNVSCNGSANGSVALVGAGGSGGYTYSQDNISFQSSGVFSGLIASATPYTFYVKDSKGCNGSVGVTITEPSAVSFTAASTAFSCSITNTKQSATITVTPTGGTGGYTYSFTNGSSFVTNNMLIVNDNGTSQSIQIIVKDANGCLSPMQQINLTPFNPPTISTITNTPIYCSPVSSTSSTVSVSLNSGTGVLPLAFEIVSGPIMNGTGATTGTFTGLTAGNYVFKVTDANGCFAIKSHTVPPVTPIVVSATKLTDVDCFGNITGAIRYNVNDFIGMYSYAINGGAAVTGQTANILTLPNLGANTYSVVFTDETTGCTAATTIVISQPSAALAATYTVINANCNVATASVTVNVTAGTGTSNYTYSFSNSNTVAGTYSSSNSTSLDPTLTWFAWVRDAKGCTIILPLTLGTDPSPTITASASGQCLGVGSYTITANGIGGIGTLTYSINGGASYQIGNTFVVTTSGSYTIRVKDANGCTADSAPVVVVPQLTLNAVLNKDITCKIGDEPARITLSPIGGSGTYTYLASPNTGSFSGTVFTTSTAGNYTFIVTDTVTGCTYTTSTAIPVTTPVNPNIISVTQTQFIYCNGDDTGAIKINYNSSLGLAPFQFSINGTTFQSSDTFTGLSAGTYIVTIRDAKECIATESITISEPTPVTFVRTITPITCGGGGVSLGSITINSVSGGTQKYTYHVTGVNGYDVKFYNQTGTSAVFDVVDFGLYQIIITDANGCTAFENNILIASPPNDLDISVTPPPSDCSALGSAIVSVGASPTSIIGSGPFYFSLYIGTAQVYPSGIWLAEDAVGSKKTTFTNLIPGVTYTFVVFDADAANGGTGTGCYYYETSTLPIPTNSTITVTPITPYNISCKGAADGNVSFTINHIYSVATPVTYQIYNSQSVTPVGAAVAAIIPASGSLVVNHFGTLPFGNYFVLITETGVATHSGCSVSSARFDITESAIDLSITATVIKNANCFDLGIITGQAKDGTASYTYQVVPAGSSVVSTDWGPSNTFTRAGSFVGIDYDVYTKDAYGCEKFVTVKVLQDVPPNITAPTPICYNGTAFTIDLVADASATASILPATYSINGSAFQSSPIFSFNAAGTYNLVIKDGNGCEATVVYEVYPKLELKALVTKSLDCTLTPEAIIVLTTTGGNSIPVANYTYELSFNGGSFVVVTNPYTATSAGTYIFRVTDTNNATICQSTTSIVLDPIPTTVFNTTVTNVSCNGGNDGSIKVNVTSGEGPYTYQLDMGTFQTSNIFTGLAAGTSYVVRVRNARQCVLSSIPITISEPTAIVATAVVTIPLSCGVGNLPQQATVTVTASGGTGVLEYSFNGGSNYSTVNIYVTNTAGIVSALVRDANKCSIAAVSAPVLPLNPPTQMDIIGSPVLCLPLASQTSTISISNVQNGVGPFTYQIISPIASIIDNGSNNIFTGLTPDTYVFQVTDNNFCTYQESYTVAPVTNINIAATVTTNVNCFGANNGSAIFKVTDFTTYTATLITGVGTPVIVADVVSLNALTPGNYTLRVNDVTTGCFADASFAITEPIALGLTLVSNINANCNSGAKVTVQGTGGTPNYTYAFVADNVTPLTSNYSSSNSASLAVILAGPTNYDVWVKDNNGCTFKLDFSVSQNTAPAMIAPTVPCFVGTPITIDLSLLATVPVGPAKYYTVNGANQFNSTFTITAPGTYDFSVTDGNGCVSNVVNFVVNPQLSLQSNLIQDLSCSNPASVTLMPMGGTNSYTTYEVDNGTGFVLITLPYTTLIAGTYKFRVTDSQGCTAESQNVIVTPNTTPTATAIATNVSCIGATDGTITLTPTGGIVPCEYSLNGNPYQFSNVFNGLSMGAYTVLVRDSKSCVSVPILVNINQPTAVTATADVTPFSCTTGNIPQDAVVTITAANGTPGYTYSFDGGASFQVSASFIVNSPQTINYVVRDANGCSFNGTAIVNTYAPPTDMDLSQSPIYCNTISAQTSITVNSVTGGVGPFVFEMISPIGSTPTTPTNTPFSFTNLVKGIYTIKVTDANGCSTTKAINVEDADKIDVSAQVIDDVYCNGSNTGILEFTVSNYITTGNYTYNLSPASASVPIVIGDVIRYTGLAAGNYTLTVTDTTSGCIATASYGISQPEMLTIFETHTEITCVTANNDGSISATATGGWPGGYEYQLELGASVIAPWSSGTNFPGLTQGTYTVRVRDSKGCSDFVNVILVNPTPIVFTAIPNTTMLSCKGDRTGSITVSTPMGGQNGNYIYTLNTTSATPAVINGPQASNLFTNLGAGRYTVTVTDGWGCSTTSAPPIVIGEPTELIASLAIATTPTCLVRATLELVVSGGTLPYSYSTTNTFASSTIMSGSNVSIAVAPGTYRYYVRDANGCIAIVTNDITIEPVPALNLNLNVLNAKINCFGDTSGAITALATGGLGNYVYTLLDGSGNTLPFVASQSYPGEFTNLPAGNYTVRVNSLDCVFTNTGIITINQPLAPLTQTVSIVNVSCNGLGNGSITLNATGGTGAVKYAISPHLDQFFDVGVFKNLTPGSYDVIAQDLNGCYIYTTGIVIDEPTILSAQVDPASIMPEICFGDKDGAFSIDINGGTAPYSVSLDKINGPFTVGTASQTQFDFTGLEGGDHTVYIRDANLCNAELTISLPASVLLIPNPTVEYGCLNNAPSSKVTVTIDASVTNSADVDYALDGSGVYQASNVFANLSPGIHFITARHTNGCEKNTADFEILQIQPLQLTLKNGGLNEIVAIASGGSPEYRYTLNGVDYGTKNTFVYYKSGNYTVTVTDSNGCVASVTLYFEFVDIEIPNVFTPNGDGNNDGWMPTNTMNYPDLIFHVFDRYGRKVGTYREGQFWDGRYNGNELPTGDYWYVLKLQNKEDSREFVGHFTLYR